MLSDLNLNNPNTYYPLMSQIIDNGNGTVTLPKELLKKLYSEHNEVKADVERCVNTIAQMLMILGIITKEGDIQENFRFKHLIKTLTTIVADSVFNSAGLEKKFAFVKDPANLKVIEKYSYLYKKNEAKKEPSIVDLEFEML